MLGLILDRQVLPHQCAVQSIAKEFPQIRYRQHPLCSIAHCRSASYSIWNAANGGRFSRGPEDFRDGIR